MKEEDVLTEAHEIEQEYEHDAEKSRISGTHERGIPKKAPIWKILGILLAIMIILMMVPYYWIKENPEPTKIPGLEIIPEITLTNNKTKIITKQDYLKIINPTEPTIKRTANKIASTSCEGNEVCQAKAIYYYVRNNFDYVSDPINKEYVETPMESLQIQAMDCEGHAVLLATLLTSIGIRTQIVFIPTHAYVRIKMPEALKTYKRNDWIYLDTTCKNCEFGQTPTQNINKKEEYLEIP